MKSVNGICFMWHHFLNSKIKGKFWKKIPKNQFIPIIGQRPIRTRDAELFHISQYDGGGPLMCPINNGGNGGGGPTYVLTGVVTWGIDCAKVGVPGVYTRITNYTNWWAILTITRCFLTWFQNATVSCLFRWVFENVGCGTASVQFNRLSSRGTVQLEEITWKEQCTQAHVYRADCFPPAPIVFPLCNAYEVTFLPPPLHVYRM